MINEEIEMGQVIVQVQMAEVDPILKQAAVDNSLPGKKQKVVLKGKEFKQVSITLNLFDCLS